jgi:hypothetical protein
MLRVDAVVHCTYRCCNDKQTLCKRNQISIHSKLFSLVVQQQINNAAMSRPYFRKRKIPEIYLFGGVGDDDVRKARQFRDVNAE